MGNAQNRDTPKVVIKSQPQQPRPSESIESIDDSKAMTVKELIQKKKAMAKIISLKHKKSKPGTQKKESQWKQDIYKIVSYWIRTEILLQDTNKDEDEAEDDTNAPFEFFNLSLILYKDIWSVIMMFCPTTYNNLIIFGSTKIFGHNLSNMSRINISDLGVEKIAISRDNVFFINEGNSVDCAGANHQRQLGLQSKDTMADDEFLIGLTRNEFIKNCGLISQGLAAQHTFYVNIDNKLYGFGSFEDGQLGINTKTRKSANPIWIQLPPVMMKCIVMDIKCGLYHSIFLVNNGQIFGCGNNEHGQLGLGKRKTCKNIKHIDKGYLMNNKTAKIIQIGCCGSTTFALDGANNKLIVFGSNINGILGCNISDETVNQNIPKMIPFFKLNDVDVMELKCGHNSICCMDTNNNIYAWGYNRYNQCGVNIKHVYKPYKLNIVDCNEEEEIKSIHCGDYHVILMTIKNNLIVFGRNDSGQCILLNMDNIKTPHFINKSDILTSEYSDIIDVITGSGFTLLAVE